MSDQAWLVTLAVVLGGAGTSLLLPHRQGTTKARTAHFVGGILSILFAVVTLWLLRPTPGVLSGLFFYLFAASSVLGAVLMVTSVNPVHSALWFAAVVLATTGLFVLAGAQFLAASTVIIYAGAIIVTFLFVIMLAQSRGTALYDRTARFPSRATVSCFALLWALLYSLVMVGGREGEAGTRPTGEPGLVRMGRMVDAAGQQHPEQVAAVLSQAVPQRSRLSENEEGVLPGVGPRHVAGLGGTLFTDHLISVQVAGVLLFIALVGAAAIATPKLPVRPRPGLRD